MNTVVLDIWKEIGVEYLYMEEGSSVQKLLTPQASAEPLEHKQISTQKNYTTKKLETPIHKKTNTLEEYIFSEEKDWDIRFQKLYSSARRTPLLWTYYHLGNDIFSKPSLERRATIQEILTALHMPQGTHSFFPFTAPNSSQALHIHTDEFRSILAKLSPSLLICFGKEGLDSFIPEKNIQFWTEFLFQAPVRAIVLPSIDTLDMSTKRKILTYIQTYVKNTGLR